MSEEVQFLKKRHSNEIANLQLQNEVQEQELEESKLAQHQLQKRLNSLMDEERGRKRRPSLTNAQGAERLAEMHSDLKVAEMRVEQFRDQLEGSQSELRLYREKEKAWNQSKMQMQQVVDTLTEKVPRDGSLTVTINGEPVDLPDLLRTKARLEGDVNSLQEQLTHSDLNVATRRRSPAAWQQARWEI